MSKVRRVRCKFTCTEKLTREQGNSEPTVDIKFYAVCDDDPESENGQFWKYTPSGELNFQTINQAAAEALIPGKDYYIDISPCDGNST